MHRFWVIQFFLGGRFFMPHPVHVLFVSKCNHFSSSLQNSRQNHFLACIHHMAYKTDVRVWKQYQFSPKSEICPPPYDRYCVLLTHLLQFFLVNAKVKKLLLLVIYFFLTRPTDGICRHGLDHDSLARVMWNMYICIYLDGKQSGQHRHWTSAMKVGQKYETLT